MIRVSGVDRYIGGPPVLVAIGREVTLSVTEGDVASGFAEFESDLRDARNVVLEVAEHLVGLTGDGVAFEAVGFADGPAPLEPKAWTWMAIMVPLG